MPSLLCCSLGSCQTCLCLVPYHCPHQAGWTWMCLYQGSWDTQRWFIFLYFQGEFLDVGFWGHRSLELSASQLFLQVPEKWETGALRGKCPCIPSSVMPRGLMWWRPTQFCVSSGSWTNGSGDGFGQLILTWDHNHRFLYREISEREIHKNPLQNSTSGLFFWVLPRDDVGTWTISFPTKGNSWCHEQGKSAVLYHCSRDSKTVESYLRRITIVDLKPWPSRRNGGTLEDALLENIEG